jgi:hypothetical protein
MLDQRFPYSVAPSAGVLGRLEGGERVMWQGRAAVAEYAFDRAASLPRWTLPEGTDVLVTNRRVLYSYASDAQDLEIISGELRWLWPQYLRVQPGARSTDRGAAASQIQLVCASADGSFPALVFAAGDLRTMGDADRLANVLRHAIARFRVDNADKLGLTTPQSRILSRLLIGPEFSNYQGGEGQTVSLAGALLVTRPAPTAAGADPSAEPEPRSEPGHGQGLPARENATRMMNPRPGLEADAQRAWRASKAEETAHQVRPDRASRAADLAARVASMVTQSGDEQAAPDQEDETYSPAHLEVPTINLTERAAAIRRSEARFAANSGRGRAGGRREAGVTTRGNRTG